jgi:hypothetical protein
VEAIERSAEDAVVIIVNEILLGLLSREPLSIMLDREV